nr:transglutaminase-like domain-containing protein [Myxococcus sp. RHSTA-1-4]
MPALEDTETGREVELSAELVAKARELGTAKAAHDFVRNGARLEWYFGSLKGATQTLRDLRGNDADLASLLIALLRAQGTPARYVRGTVELRLSALAAAMGLLSPEEASALDASQHGGAPFVVSELLRQRVLQVLAAAAIPFEPVSEGAQVVAVRLAHIWVEAYLPYADYRGVGEGGRQWVPLEPALTGRAKVAATSPVLSALEAMAETPTSLMDAYLAQRSAQSPLEFVRGRIQAWLAAQRPDVTYEQVLRTVSARPEALPFIPGSLPYPVVSVQEELAFLPESAQQRVRLSGADANGPLFDVTLPLHQLTGHIAVLGYKPATAADQELVQSSGGLYLAPASLVDVVPVVRVGGQEVAVGGRAVGLGTQHTWRLELLLPGGAVRQVENRVVAGNFIALGVGAPGNAYVEGEGPEGLDGAAVRFLYGRAAAYASAWTQSEEELARLTQVLPVRPTGNFVFVQNQLQVDSVLGVPRRVEWKGLELDADLRTLTPVELRAGAGRELLRLSGYEGSFLEARVLAQGSGVPTVASTSVLQEAARQGIAILNLTPENQETELPRLSATPEVLRDVRDLLALGRHVRIPATPVVLEDWTGTGFIAHAPATEEAGYFLSGRLSGGQTVVSPGRWPEATLVEQLRQPDAPPAEEDVTKVAEITKVAETDFQQTQAGKLAPRQLRVYVVTEDGRPVKGAAVTFFRHGDAKPGLAAQAETLQAVLSGPGSQVVERVHALPAEVTVTTNEYGQAGVYMTPDPNFSRVAIFAPTTPEQPHAQLLGLSEVLARVTDGNGNQVQVVDSFRVTALPEAPARLVPFPGALVPAAPAGLELGHPLAVWVQDRFDNRLANQPVTWTSLAGDSRFFDYDGLPPDSPLRKDLNVRVLDFFDPLQVPSVMRLSSTEGQVKVDFIPGYQSTSGEVLAQVAGLTQTFSVPTEQPDYVFRPVIQRGVQFGGIHGTRLASPVAGVVLRRVSGGGWVPLEGPGGDLSRVEVTMEVRDRLGTLLLSETRVPRDVDTSMPGDDRTKAIFWPTYVVEDGYQYITFRGRVDETQDSRQVCCGQSFYIEAPSGRAKLSVAQVKPTLEKVVLAGEPVLAAETRYLELSVSHPSDAPLYLRVVQTPVSGTGDIVRVPGPDVFKRHPSDASLVEVPASLGTSQRPDGTLSLSRTDFSFPVVPDTVGGLVSFELYQDRAAYGEPPALSAVRVSRKVEVLASPSFYLVGDDGERLSTEDDPTTFYVGLQPYADYLAGQARRFRVELWPPPTDGREYKAILKGVTGQCGVETRVELALTLANQYRSEWVTAVAGYSSRDDLFGEAAPPETELPDDGGFPQSVVSGDAGDECARDVLPVSGGADGGDGGVGPAGQDGGALMAVPPGGALQVEVQGLGEKIEKKVRDIGIDLITSKSDFDAAPNRDPAAPGVVWNPARLCVPESGQTDPPATFVLKNTQGLENLITWSLDANGTGVTFVGGNKGPKVQLSPATTTGPFPGLPGKVGLEISVDKAKSRASASPLTLTVKNYRTIKVRPFAVVTDCDDADEVSEILPPEWLAKDLAATNNIWRQACVRFTRVDGDGPATCREATAELVAGDYSTKLVHEVMQLDTLSQPDRKAQFGSEYMEMYYRRRFIWTGNRYVLAVALPRAGIAVAAGNNVRMDPKTHRQLDALKPRERELSTAHEYGHHLGLNNTDGTVEPSKVGPSGRPPYLLPTTPPYGAEETKEYGHAMNDNSLMYFKTGPEAGSVDISEEEADFVDRVNRSSSL